AEDAIPVSGRNREPGAVDLVPRRIPRKRVTGLQESYRDQRTVAESSDRWINRPPSFVLNDIVDVATSWARGGRRGDGPISFNRQREREAHGFAWQVVRSLGSHDNRHGHCGYQAATAATRTIEAPTTITRTG